jgi:hypothetical protein
MGVVTSAELAVFCRQIGAMLVAGVDLLRALQVAADQCSSQRLKSVVRQVRTDLEDGRLLATALTRFPDLFSPFFLSLVRQGEREGVLAQVMTQMADYLALESGGFAGQTATTVGRGGVDLGELIEKLKPLVFWQMLTLGVIALGIAALWWANLWGFLPTVIFGPNIALWVAVCILVSALIFRQFRPVRIVHCSFCARSESLSGPLVQGPGVAICPACLRSNVEQMKSLIRHEEEERALATAEEALGSRAEHPEASLSNGAGPPDDYDEPSSEER